ncbi:amino acid permease [Colletotrichum graminicola]|nr:amino acid permease [Colletotrichum graminicola]
MSKLLDKLNGVSSSPAATTDSEVGRIENAREAKRQIGVTTAIFLVVNRVIGTGIFATPGTIFALSGSVGLSLFIWVAGMIIALAGTAVYLEWGTAIPKNGGEKNYLEYVFRKPKFLTTGLYTGYVVLLGWASGNSVVFGEYILHAANVEVDRWNQRAIGLACITSAFLIHGLALNWGLRLQNLLGSIKLIIILIIILCGFIALGGHVKLPEDQKPKNFTNAFEGTTGSPYGVVTALYNVIWSYIGYSNANYALSETKNPVRTLKIAAPAAIVTISILYMLVNVAYFAAVPREEILEGGRLVAASLFRNVMGGTAERALSVFVALSAFGNVLSVIFSQGRLVQELGREGILPWSRFFASNKPFNAPLAGLFEHWLICVITMLAPPPGVTHTTSFSTSSATPSPSSTSSLLPAWLISTSTAASGTGTLPSAPLCPSSSSSCSATSTSSSLPSCPPRKARTSTRTSLTISTALSVSPSSLPGVSTGLSGPRSSPRSASTSWSARPWSTRSTAGNATYSSAGHMASLLLRNIALVLPKCPSNPRASGHLFAWCTQVPRWC